MPCPLAPDRGASIELAMVVLRIPQDSLAVNGPRSKNEPR